MKNDKGSRQISRGAVFPPRFTAFSGGGAAYASPSFFYARSLLAVGSALTLPIGTELPCTQRSVDNCKHEKKQTFLVGAGTVGGGRGAPLIERRGNTEVYGVCSLSESQLVFGNR